MKAKSLDGDTLDVFLLDTLIMESLADESGSESIVEFTTRLESAGESGSSLTAGVLVETESDGLLKATGAIEAEAANAVEPAAALTGLREGALTERAGTMKGGEYGAANVSIDGNFGREGVVPLSKDDNGGSIILGVDLKASTEGKTGLCLSGVVVSIMKRRKQVGAKEGKGQSRVQCQLVYANRKNGHGKKKCGIAL